jgi:hypothetical protein
LLLYSSNLALGVFQLAGHLLHTIKFSHIIITAPSTSFSGAVAGEEEDFCKGGLNFSSRNLLDSAAGGTFMSLTFGTATKLLDNMMVNYSEWHTERTPQGKKVNSIEETDTSLTYP